ncbi:hypothetical protein SAMN05421810_111147 [Amycolatopsis arida]|uniref:DUF3592 domain-containing protein n=1 Tax=Amycolatopsis arida TaxID=587909 RepID=A0A1I6A7D3_9PSEU|nr:DUF3592 domain-containing protein [Amycolatopsis arida]TDX88548.1 hypothetical protein CLV69_11166 [Amycolatopsis arida]SFQ64646.1 hypothetical protein SAMN05421810_111147 [Amycolatopsis arida]
MLGGVVVDRERAWRLAGRVVLGVAGALTLLCVALLFAAVRNDRAIAANLGTANARVEQVNFDRTIIRYETPDGVAHIPSNGVLYPEGLETGDLVWIEYDTTNPELARVAGRTAVLTLLPLGTTILFTWLVAGPALWWIRHRRLSGPLLPVGALRPKRAGENVRETPPAKTPADA